MLPFTSSCPLLRGPGYVARRGAGAHYSVVGSPNTAPLSSTSGVLVCT